ncbi:MAG: hypothetical protein DRO06_04645 [Thermoproteota archaeon]|nr:MAG: hypothetical protein DRO06_04645 [Candidatus Korarchaeota archaeon]
MIVLPGKRGFELLSRASPVRVHVLRDLDTTPLLPWKVSSGGEVELPEWLVEVLEREGLVARVEERAISDLDRAIHKEGSLTRPARIGGDFYSWLSREIRRAMEDPTLHPADKRRVLDRAREFAIRRLAKIVRYALLSQEAGDVGQRVLSRLTLHERVIYHHLRAIISRWISEVLAEEGGSDG